MEEEEGEEGEEEEGEKMEEVVILLMQMPVGPSLSEPHTSVTSLHPCVCMHFASCDNS